MAASKHKHDDIPQTWLQVASYNELIHSYGVYIFYDVVRGRI